VSYNRLAFSEAKLLRLEFGLPDGRLDPFAVAEGMGIQVVSAPIGTDSPVEGCYLRRVGRPFILVNSSKAYRRQRFTCAHEIGHHRLLGNAEQEFEVIEDSAAIDGKGSADERQACLFASALLMPEDGVRALVANVPDLWDQVGAIIGRYDVSLDCAAIRLHELDLATDHEVKAFLKAAKADIAGFYRAYDISATERRREDSVEYPRLYRDLVEKLGGLGVLAPERYEELAKRDLPESE
jgi:Zn-dependent peptidase ImmA (M78 family)